LLIPDPLTLNTEPENVVTEPTAVGPELHSRSFMPVLLGCLIVLVMSATIFAITIKYLGHWYYPLDDTYIGMSLSKHLVQLGGMGDFY
jgi:hypothetical protein